MRTPSHLSSVIRYVSLVSAGICIFEGLIILAGLVGVRWHSNYMWVELNAYVISMSADLTIWAVTLGLSLLPFYYSVTRHRSSFFDLALICSSLLVPLASMAMLTWSYEAAFVGLVTLGFLVASGLAVSSSRLLGMTRRDACRIIVAATLICLGGVSLVAIVGLAGGGARTLWLLGQAPVLSDEALSNPWARAMALDLELFYFLRPALAPLVALLVLAAIVAVLWEPVSYVLKPFRSLLAKSGRGRLSAQWSGDGKLTHNRFAPVVAVLVMIGSVLVAAFVTLYPYVFGYVDGMLGSDTWNYLEVLRAPEQPLALIRSSDRPLFLLLLFGLKYITGATPLAVLTYTPLVISALLSLTTFALVKQATKDMLFASVAALFSVVSIQTAIGLGAAIFANWFALALMNLFFAVLLKAQMDRSTAAVIMAPVASFLVLLAHPYVWGASMVMVAIQVAGMLLRRPSKFSEFKRDAVPLASVILLNIAFVYLGSSYVPAVQGSLSSALLRGQSALAAIDLSSAVTLLEWTIDYAKNRLDVTMMVILSIVGILDVSLLPRQFRRVVGSMMIVPIVFTLLAPDFHWTWRGLYLLPTYLGGALGARSIVLRANSLVGAGRRESMLRFMFSGSFFGYVFLSCLAWTVRATILLIETSVVVR